MKVWYTLSVDGGTPDLLHVFVQNQDAQDDDIKILNIKNAVKVAHANKLATIDASDLEVTTTSAGRILFDYDEWDSTMGGATKALPLRIEASRPGTFCSGNWTYLNCTTATNVY
jgi:hypothetical protein